MPGATLNEAEHPSSIEALSFVAKMVRGDEHAEIP
jgi:hypothetical protein